LPHRHGNRPQQNSQIQPNAPVVDVPEVVIDPLLHLRDLALIDDTCMTAAGQAWGGVLDWWEKSDRRKRVRAVLEKEGIDPDDVIMSPARAKDRGLTSTVTFPRGNLCPDGAVIKSTAVDPSVVDADGIFRMVGPARVFLSERSAIAAVKDGAISAGDVIVLICCGPMGSGMEETYQLTAALRDLPFGKNVALVTDARFSGVSTGACIGHVGPEALAGGPIGKLLNGDRIRIRIDTKNLEGTLDFILPDHSLDMATKILQSRPMRRDLASHPQLPADTKLWAALTKASGGTWGGCVYDVEAICKKLSE
jgi:dihydroxyacid dehydratase/phosphogluconate dehydratase